MTLEWQEILYSIWLDGHLHPKWCDIYEIHEKEDQEYFMKLEEEYERNTTVDARRTR